MVFSCTEENSQKQTEDLGSQFTEIFIKQQENVTLLLTYLEVSISLVLRSELARFCETHFGRNRQCVGGRGGRAPSLATDQCISFIANALKTQRGILHFLLLHLVFLIVL